MLSEPCGCFSYLLYSGMMPTVGWMWYEPGPGSFVFLISVFFFSSVNLLKVREM